MKNGSKANIYSFIKNDCRINVFFRTTTGFVG